MNLSVSWTNLDFLIKVGLRNENRKPHSNYPRVLISNWSEKSEYTAMYWIGHFKIKKIPKIKSDRSNLYRKTWSLELCPDQVHTTAGTLVNIDLIIFHRTFLYFFDIFRSGAEVSPIFFKGWKNFLFDNVTFILPRHLALLRQK